MVFAVLSKLDELKVRLERVGGAFDVSLGPGEIGIGVDPASSHPEAIFVPGLDADEIRTSCLAAKAMNLPVPEDNQNCRADLQEIFLRRLLESSTLVVTDASPDRVLAFVVLLFRLISSEKPVLLDSWISAARAVRLDGSVFGPPKQNWIALHAAGTHSIISHFTDPGRNDTYGKAWLQASRFIADALRNGFMPDAMPIVPSIRHQPEFMSAFEREKEIYHGWLEHAEIVQLRLPMRLSAGEGNERFRVVDAIFYEELEPIGAGNIFMRTDTEHSPLGRGFSVGVAYRPQGRPGNRFFVTSDVNSGITLKWIHTALEQTETQAWQQQGKERPSTLPRPLLGVPENAWNEPWFDGYGEFKFLAEPREQTLPDGSEVTGSLLSWADVKRAIWETSSPLRHVVLAELLVDMENPSRSPPASYRSIWEICQSPALAVAGCKKISSLRWAPKISADNAAISMNSVLGALASLPNNRISQHEVFSGIASPKSFDKIEVPGGFGLVTNEGVVLFDDWRPTPLPIGLLIPLFEASAERDKVLSETLAKLSALQELFASILVSKPANNGNTTRKSKKVVSASIRQAKLEKLLENAVAVQLELKRIDQNYQSVVARLGENALSDPAISRWKMALDQRWALSERSETYENLVNLMMDSVQKALDLGNRRFQRFVFLLGFAITPAAVISEPLGRLLNTAMPVELTRMISGLGFDVARLPDALQIMSAIGLAILLYFSLSAISNGLDRSSLKQTTQA